MSVYAGALTLLVGFVAGALAMFVGDLTRPRDVEPVVEALGALVVDEVVVPVTGVRLDRGAFVTTAYVRGPVPAVDSTDYVLLGMDGRVVYRSARGVNRVQWPALRPGDTLRVVLASEVAGRTAF